MTDRPLLYLSDRDVRGILDARMAIEVGERTLIELANGGVDWCEPRQLQVSSPAYPTRIRAKSCVLRSRNVGGTRVFAINRTEAGRRVAAARPTRVVLLTDPESGALLAILDEQWSSAVRTGAGVAIAAKHLARREGRPVVAILGAGYVAETSLTALREVCDPSEVRIFAPPEGEREGYARKMSERLGLRVLPVGTPEEAVRGAVIICAATSAKEPFVRDEWLGPGSFVYSLGEFQELRTEAYLRTSKLIVDDWEQVKLKADIVELLARGVLSREDVYAELADVVAGRKPGRESNKERIIVRSQGLAPQDVAVAHAVYEIALERGVGLALGG